MDLPYTVPVPLSLAGAGALGASVVPGSGALCRQAAGMAVSGIGDRDHGSCFPAVHGNDAGQTVYDGVRCGAGRQLQRREW